MKKAIITSVIILAVLTGAGILALSGTSGKTGKKIPEPSGDKISTETRQFLEEDKEKKTGQEVLDEIMNVGSGSKDATAEVPSEKHEISREKYEKCGYDTGTYIIKYSDGSYDIVEGE